MLLVSSSSLIQQPISNNQATPPSASTPTPTPLSSIRSPCLHHGFIHLDNDHAEKTIFVCFFPGFAISAVPFPPPPPLRRSCNFPPPLQNPDGCSGGRVGGADGRLFLGIGGFFFSFLFSLFFCLPSPPNWVNRIRPAAPFMHDIRQVGMRRLVDCGADVRSYLLVRCAATMVKPNEA